MKKPQIFKKRRNVTLVFSKIATLRGQAATIESLTAKLAATRHIWQLASVQGDIIFKNRLSPSFEMNFSIMRKNLP